MPEAVLLSAVRTPVGRYGGGLAGVRPDDLAAVAIAAAVERAGVPQAEIEDVWLGCANQAGEDNRNVARFAALLAGLPGDRRRRHRQPPLRLGACSGRGGGHAVIAGDGDLFVAGGVESMSRAPLVTAKPDAAFPRGDRVLHDTTIGWRFTNPRYAERFSTATMGETGENVAERWGVSRADQDAFASPRSSAGRRPTPTAASPTSSSRSRASSATSIRGPTRRTEKLASLKPAFARRRNGHRRQRERHQRRCRRTRGGQRGARRVARPPAAGDVPRIGGRGRRPGGDGHRPVPAVRKLLERAGLAVDEVDLVELNEAFASQSVAVIRELGLDPERVNVNGGAIAIGHPLGMSGARLVVTLLHELRRRGGRYGIATMCVGVGQGQAALFERTH